MIQQRRGEKYIMRRLMICIDHKFYSADKIEKNEMGGACSAYGKRIGVYSNLVGKQEGK
jgi:hypothetical protein